MMPVTRVGIVLATSNALDVSPDAENAVISKIFNLYDHYATDVKYAKNPFRPVPGYYNSNSYISGLLDAAGVAKPSYLTDASFPDWENPVPPNDFGVKP